MCTGNLGRGKEGKKRGCWIGQKPGKVKEKKGRGVKEGEGSPTVEVTKAVGKKTGRRGARAAKDGDHEF